MPKFMAENVISQRILEPQASGSQSGAASTFEDAREQAVYYPMPLMRDRVLGLAFFDIAGRASNTYAVALHRKTPAEDALTGFSLITFDRLSRPAAVGAEAAKRFLPVSKSP